MHQLPSAVGMTGGAGAAQLVPLGPAPGPVLLPREPPTLELTGKWQRTPRRWLSALGEVDLSAAATACKTSSPERG